MVAMMTRTTSDKIRTTRFVRRELVWTDKPGHPPSPLGEGCPLSGHLVRPEMRA